MFFFSLNYIFLKISLRLPLWLIDYLEVYFIDGKCLEIFCYLLIINFQFYSIVVRKHIVISLVLNVFYDFSSFKVCFMAHDMVCHGSCSKGICKEYVFGCHWMELLYKCQLDVFGLGDVEYFYILGDFLYSYFYQSLDLSVYPFSSISLFKNLLKL